MPDCLVPTFTFRCPHYNGGMQNLQLTEVPRILIEWGNCGSMTAVEWIFTPYENDTAYVTITNSGFKEDGDKVVKDARDSKGGFTWVLAGLKALLEHNIELNAIADAFPKGLKK